jgi:hypothetical protein
MMLLKNAKHDYGRGGKPSLRTEVHIGAAYPRIVRASCICCFCIILIVGLWPFHASKNEVGWLKNEDGLHFGRHGSIVSSGAIRSGDSSDDTSSSLEIWLEPSLTAERRTILSFDGSEHPGSPFSLYQNRGALRVQRYNVDTQGTSRTAWFEVDSVFRKGEPVFVTVTLDEQGTSVYLDGVLAKVSPILGISSNNLTGRLIVSGSPTVHDSWSGRILGLAIYHRQLTPTQVAHHYESWTKTRWPVVVKDEAPVAAYSFNERDGNVVHNQLDPATDLIIPPRYFVLHRGFLLTPWHEYRSTWSYWRDVSINIAGFIPLGFCVVAYLSSVRLISRPAATTIVLGFITSLTIETLQAFLPTRSSGMTDIITNTLGTAAGVMLYHWSLAQNLLTGARWYGVRKNFSRGADPEGGLSLRSRPLCDENVPSFKWTQSS